MINLSKVKDNTSVKIISINGCFGFKQKLAEMGILENSTIKVMKNDGNGPLILYVKGARIAIGRCMSQKIMCEKL